VRRNAFVSRSLLLFALVAASFVVLGFGRLVLPYRVARLLAAPLLFAGAVLAAVLVAQAALAAVGILDVD
jgi:Tfp pilus assembly protein PilN